MWLAVAGGGNGKEWPVWGQVLFLVVWVLIGIFVFTKRWQNRRKR